MDILFLLTFGVTFLAGIVSGMGGGGGGFVVIPYFIAIGLPPANALATAKFGALGTAAGSLSAFKGKGLVDKKYLSHFVIITLVCALISAWLIPKIDAEVFEKIIGVVLLLMAPTLFIKKAAFQPGPRSRSMIMWGFVAYTFFSFGQTLFGTGIGTMLILVLMFLFGMDALHASATKRVVQGVQAVILFILLAIQGLVNWGHAVAGFLGTIIGTHIGTEFALERGTQFVKYMLAVVMVTSGVALLLT
ncbi:MAG TPA: sulfite exporter TauE/SafE family protein [Candidatus Saccharimonadales bacterium]|nr:sulfite exporter TauE/SafE family protein [Candidatus Saccharimonadales bacterium]